MSEDLNNNNNNNNNSNNNDRPRATSIKLPSYRLSQQQQQQQRSNRLLLDPNDLSLEFVMTYDDDEDITTTASGNHIIHRHTISNTPSTVAMSNSPTSPNNDTTLWETTQGGPHNSEHHAADDNDDDDEPIRDRTPSYYNNRDSDFVTNYPNNSDRSIGRNSSYVVVVDDLSLYTVESSRPYESNEKEILQNALRNCIEQNTVVMITRTWCPFTKTVISLLVDELQVLTHVIYIDQMKYGDMLVSYAKAYYKYRTIPLIFIKGQLIGGCDSLYALYESGQLEEEPKYLFGEIHASRTKGTERVETAQLTPPPKTGAVNPYFWFPNTVNNNVNRLVGIQVTICALLSVVFYEQLAGQYIAVFLTIDFTLRMISGAVLSPLAVIATLLSIQYKPDFRPGPPKQFAAAVGLVFSLVGTILYFIFDIPLGGAIVMAMLCGAAGLEGFFDFCLGCVFYGFGIQFGIFSSAVYKIYTASREEVSKAWDYRCLDTPGVIPPTIVDCTTSANEGTIGLKYKKKSDEWTKDDFHFIRNVQISYFAMPAALGFLGVAFKFASKEASEPFFFVLLGSEKRDIIINPEYYYFLAALSVMMFSFLFLLYLFRYIQYPKKVWKEWDHPMKSNGFAFVSITLFVYCITLYSDTNTGSINRFVRVIYWIATVCQFVMLVSKIGEWIGRRLELEHFSASYLLHPLGMIMSAYTAIYIKAINYDRWNVLEYNGLLARFLFGLPALLVVTIFVLSFFKVVTTHNTCPIDRHTYWLWIVAACAIGLTRYGMCITQIIDMMIKNADDPVQNKLLSNQYSACTNDFSTFYFGSIILFIGLFWAALPHYSFFGQDTFSSAYWIECCALSALACCSALFYSLNGYRVSGILQFTFLVIACIGNFAAIVNFYIGIIRRCTIFTPDVKFTPLAFMKLTHDAIRENIPKILHYLHVIDLDDPTNPAKENLAMFAAQLNRFRIVHEEHSKHEDDVVFKMFNDFFPKHAAKYNEDHMDDHRTLQMWIQQTNIILDATVPLPVRNGALENIRASMPDFFRHFKAHLSGEEENLNPVGRKYIPITLAKEMSREVWKITPSEKWEVIVPFIVNNLPRHPQRVKYIQILTMSMPERSQQIGAIIYRNVDSVMWERLRTELPEIIPRGAPNWRRYY